MDKPDEPERDGGDEEGRRDGHDRFPDEPEE
jgi:hypothetical protein